MHVTVAFDHKKHDWRDLPLDAEDAVAVIDPDERMVSLFKNAIVLEIYSLALATRWAELHQSALNWKYPDYRPHVTITFNAPKGMDASKIEPFDGVIHLGPEIATEVMWNQRLHLNEEQL